MKPLASSRASGEAFPLWRFTLTDKLKSERDRVLVENTAQAVFKHLNHIEQYRTTIGLRWVWELLQNARDSARTCGVRIRIRLSESELRFEHDGKPFSYEEITHLVYHGSTKFEDFESIGQFGSGFLSTHLLSRMVRVGGCLEDSSKFDFLLDRTGETVNDLRLAMDRSWRALEQSAQHSASAQLSTNTYFVYKVSEQRRELV